MRPMTIFMALTSIAILLFAGAAFAVGLVHFDQVVTGVALANGVAAADFKKLAEVMELGFNKFGDRFKAMAADILELQQARGTRPAAGLPGAGGGDLADLIMAHAGAKDFLAGKTPSCTINVPARSVYRNVVVNPAPGVTDPLRQPDRSRPIVTAPQLRMTIRGLFNAVPSATGTVEVVSESFFVDNTGIQGGDASPTGSGEGAALPQSDTGFGVTSMNIPTIGHYITASRQVLHDAPRLQAHIETRLLYWLALKEETQFMTGAGTGLQMAGLNTRAAAFTGGATNQTALDTISKALSQLATANYEPTDIVLHPADWNAITLAKNSQGDYIVGDPALMTVPQLWGKPVVPTPSQSIGRFTVLDAMRAGYVADCEEASVRVSEINDQAIRNLVTILAQERALLVIEDGNAVITGTLSHAG